MRNVHKIVKGEMGKGEFGECKVNLDKIKENQEGFSSSEEICIF